MARTSDKVPTEISYTSAGEIHKWGFEIKPSVARLKWFKLLLDPTKYASNSSSTIARTKALIPRSKRPVNVVADYLSCLRKHTLKTLERSYSKAFVDVTPIDYCLTVPAVIDSPAPKGQCEISDPPAHCRFGTMLQKHWPSRQLSLRVLGRGTQFDSYLSRKLLRRGVWWKTSSLIISRSDLERSYLKYAAYADITCQVNDAFVVVDCGGGTVVSHPILTSLPEFSYCGFSNKLGPHILQDCGDKAESWGEGMRCGCGGFVWLNTTQSTFRGFGEISYRTKVGAIEALTHSRSLCWPR